MLRLRVPVVSSDLRIQTPRPATHPTSSMTLATYLIFLNLFLYLNDRDSNFLKGLLGKLNASKELSTGSVVP